MQNLCYRRVRVLLTLAMLLALVSEPAWAQSIFSHGGRRPLEAATPAWAARAKSRGTMYRIHGTNRPGSMGGAVSHGCFRMHNSTSSTYLRRYRSAQRLRGAVNSIKSR